MIFVTIGLQLPFDRLIEAVDNVAADLPKICIVAQISSMSKYKAKNIRTIDFVSPSDFRDYFAKAELIVSHAGMGTIISALEIQKPIIVMPRLVKYKEVTTDHQLATAMRFESQEYIHAAFDGAELKEKIVSILNGKVEPPRKVDKFASSQLVDSIRSFIVS